MCEQVKKFYPTTHFIHCLYSKFQIKQWPLCHKHTGTSNFFDLLLCSSTEELCFHNYRLLRQLALAQDFVVSLERLKKKKKLCVYNQLKGSYIHTCLLAHTSKKQNHHHHRWPHSLSVSNTRLVWMEKNIPCDLVALHSLREVATIK